MRKAFFILAGFPITYFTYLSLMNTLRNKHVLVTGGAGFIGCNLVRTLVEKYGAKVTVLDNLFNGNCENLYGISHQFVLGSVEDKEAVNACVRGKDIVFHLAVHNINVSNHAPHVDLNVNVGGSYNVFEACLEHKVKRVIYTSSSAIYGNASSLPIRESDEKRFLSFYSASKYSAEVYAKTFYEVFDLPVTILRYSNVYGSYQSSANPYCGVIGKFIEAALDGAPLKVHGDGEQTRDYTYIADAVDATIRAAVYPQAIGQDYNIGTGMETSVIELARTITQLTKSSSFIKHVENRDIDNIRYRCIDIAKSVRDLNYQPHYDLQKGLHSTIQWFLQANPKPAGVTLL